ncbi:MAG TPA: phosphate acyltransferase PlsX [Gemmatimonadales bacterium]|nr:phosphate acyltransferase PlsX [Gemmatimonadales bacterium]
MRIVLDAMGGDYAPEAPVAGAVEALADLPPSTDVVLVGRAAEVKAELAKHGTSDHLEVIEAPDVVGMAEKPLAAVRSKPNSSIGVGLRLQREGKAHAFISAGNTGAVMAASALMLGLHPGVERPAIATLFPTATKPVLVLDAGANVDCSPRELRGFAHLGSVYARDVLGRPSPAVGLLSIGEEAEKGNAAVKEAHGLLREEAHAFRFVGNVEGRDILRGEVDVVVCDGFVGNVVLKFYEQVAQLFTGLLKREIEGDMLRSEGMKRVFTVLDYSTYGGAPLLGVRGVSIICHGRSSARAIRNAIRVAVQAAQSGLSQHIGADLSGGEDA